MAKSAKQLELDGVEKAADDCVPTLVHRVAALLDKDPDAYQAGNLLPRGWHVALFTVSTPQSKLRSDGVAGLGFTLPDLQLPRLMMGGRRTQFYSDVVIGTRVTRQSRVVSITPKQGRSGRIAVVTVRHEIFADDAGSPAIIEEQDFVMREEASSSVLAMAKPASTSSPSSDVPTATRELIPTEAMLFRYSAITFNTHLIHYDYMYATGVEKYPGLVVNGGLSALLLIEFFKELTGTSPSSFNTRNVGPLFCGHKMRLHASKGAQSWNLWVEDEHGHVSLSASAE